MKRGRSWHGGVAAGIAAYSLLACNLLSGASTLSFDGANPAGSSAVPTVNPDDVEVTPTALDFGPVSCGATGKPLSLTIRNKSSAPVPYSVAIPEGTPFAIVGSIEGTVPAASSVAVALLATPQAPGDASADVTVSFGAVAKTVTMKASGSGAAVSLGPAEIAFGDVRMQNGGSAEVTLTNPGTQPLVVTGWKGETSAFSISWAGKPSPLQIAPGQSTKLTVSLAPGAMPSGPLVASLSPIVQGVTCGELPPLAVTGALVNLEVTLSNADFDRQGCNTQPTLTKGVLVTNYSASPLTISAALKSGSLFALVSGGNVALVAGSTTAPTTATIALALPTVPAQTAVISEDITLAITGLPPPSGGARTTKARVDVRGATLAITPPSFALTSKCTCAFTCTCPTATGTFEVKNTGNESMTLSWDLAVTMGQAKTFRATSPATIPPGGSSTGTATFAPSAVGSYKATLTPRSNGGGPLCNTLSPVALTGTSTN